MNEVIIDVRERDEFDSEHAPGSVNLPLSTFNSQAPGVLTQLKDKKLIVMCRSGNRAKLAVQQAQSLGLAFEKGYDYDVYEGGILRWKREGKEVVSKKRSHFPLMRQTHAIAGSIVLASVLLGYLIDSVYFGIAGFVGAGLLFAGLSGVCMLTNILALMPWNRNGYAQERADQLKPTN